MPSSASYHLWHLHTKVMNLQPKKILDVGIWFGSKWYVFRELTDIRHLRYTKPEWTTKIDGIEIFEKYITDVHRHIYDTIHIWNALDILPTIEDWAYDLVYCWDVIEHFTREDWEKLLSELKRISKRLYICTPNIFMPQWDAYGNENERHLSFWTPQDFKWWEINNFWILMTCYIDNSK